MAAAPAHGELVGRFDAGLRNVKPYGAYTVVASGRVVVRDGACTTVDHRALREEAVAARVRLVAAADRRDGAAGVIPGTMQG